MGRAGHGGEKSDPGESKAANQPNHQAVRAALMRLRSLRLKPKAAPAPRMGRGPRDVTEVAVDTGARGHHMMRAAEDVGLNVAASALTAGLFAAAVAVPPELAQVVPGGVLPPWPFHPAVRPPPGRHPTVSPLRQR